MQHILEHYVTHNKGHKFFFFDFIAVTIVVLFDLL